MSDRPRGKKFAPQFPVPDVAIVSVEHPCVVKNVEKAIRMLGHDRDIADSLAPGNDKPLGLRFQPDDTTSREVVSYNKKTNSLLLKVTVPKRKGREGEESLDRDLAGNPPEVAARKDVDYLLRSMKDNPQRYRAQIVGSIHSTHVWRTMPDFVYSTKGSMFLGEVQTKILPQKYPELKQWSLPRPSAAALADTDAIPPPAFSTHSLPQNYVYRQNTSTKSVAATPATRDATAQMGDLPDRSRIDDEEQPHRPSWQPAQNAPNLER
jgi:general transcription factor 3C polypeptide 5 (transcription factor C subunit 1)